MKNILAYLDTITEEEEYAEEMNWEQSTKVLEDKNLDLSTPSVNLSKIPQPIVNTSEIQDIIEQVIEEKDKHFTQLQVDFFQETPIDEKQIASMKNKYKGTYNHWTGSLYYIVMSRIDNVYAIMYLSGYN